MTMIGRLLVGCAVVGLSGYPAMSQDIRTVQGERFWEGNPGPITDAYWVSGQYRYDPDGFLERNAFDDDGLRRMTVFGDHSGAANCVLRRRVAISDWDWRHPHLRICRFPPFD